MTFRVLRLGDPLWLQKIAALPEGRRDFHFDPRMLAPFAATFNWQAGLALSENSLGFVIQPFLITKEKQLRHAFNFGGPVASTAVSADYHNSEMEKFAHKQGVTSQFCTLNPFFTEQKHLVEQYNPKYVKDTVVVDLNNVKVRGTTRRLAMNAQANGWEVNSVPLDPLHISIFHRMYSATMERTGAKEHWKFSLGFFNSFCRFVNPLLLMVSRGGRGPEAGALVIRPEFLYNDYAYYHFAGSFNSYPDEGLNHLLVMSAIEICKNKQAKFLHLGGGVKPNDGLFTFKSGFSKMRLPIYIYETGETEGLV